MGEENNKQQTKYDEKMKNWRKNSETVVIEETEPTINNVITTETTQETTTTKITVKLRQPTLQETTKIRNKKLKPPDPDTTPETSNQNTFETKRNGFKGVDDSTLQCKLQVGGLGDAIRVELKASQPRPQVGDVQGNTKQDSATTKQTSNNNTETKQTTKTTNNKQQTMNKFLVQSPKTPKSKPESTDSPNTKKKKTRNVASEKKTRTTTVV